MIRPIPIPDIQKVEKIIEGLNAIDFKNITIEELEIYFNQIMDGYRINVFRPSIGLLLYRGILYDEKPSLFENIIYPPENKAPINRASNKGQQMFYCSTSSKAVFYELNVEAGDKLVISSWTTNNALLFTNVGYTKLNFEKLSASRAPSEFLLIEDEKNKFIAEYLANTFCQPISEITNYLYKVTIAIARIHLKDGYDDKFSGLFYPTVKLNAEEENFAINKVTIDQGLLDFMEIQFIEVLEKVGNRYKYKIIDVADNIIEDNIMWKNLNSEWTVYDDSDQLFFVDEDNQTIAYNDAGDIINSD